MIITNIKNLSTRLLQVRKGWNTNNLAKDGGGIFSGMRRREDRRYAEGQEVSYAIGSLCEHV